MMMPFQLAEPLIVSRPVTHSSPALAHTVLALRLPSTTDSAGVPNRAAHRLPREPGHGRHRTDGEDHRADGNDHEQLEQRDPGLSGHETPCSAVSGVHNHGLNMYSGQRRLNYDSVLGEEVPPPGPGG